MTFLTGTSLSVLTPVGVNRQGLRVLFRCEIVPRQHPADIMQATLRVVPFGRAFRMVRQRHRDLAFETAKFGPCQLHQLAQCQHAHCFLHCFPAAPIAAFWWRPCSGGGGCIACDRNEVEECAALAPTQPTNGAKRPKEGRDWCRRDEGYVRCRGRSLGREVKGFPIATFSSKISAG